MAMSGIKTLMHLGSLGKTNLQGYKVANRLGVTSAILWDCQGLNNVVVFLGNTLEENKVRSLLKVS